MKKKIIVRIKGGLGNQLYCYAAARRLSLKNQAELVIDNISGFSRDLKYKRQYKLDLFCISARTATPCERGEPFERVRRGFRKLYSRNKDIDKKTYIEQKFQEFDQRILNLKINKNEITLDGLWQSELYFNDVKDVIREDLQLNINISENNKKILKWIEMNKAIAIHVRWFSEDKKNAAKYNVPLSYYLEAINYLKKKIDNPYFVIFSDNPIKAEKMLNLPTNNSLVINSNLQADSEIEDFFLMKNCHHFILANSTFSWWAAWLSSVQLNKIVVFPRINKSKNYNWSWDYHGQMPASWVPILLN